MIKIFSTYTVDKIRNFDNGSVITRSGGPVLFFESVFKKYGIDFEIKSQKAVIEIKIKNGIEAGVLKNKLKEKKISGIKNDDSILVSTVDNEWTFEEVVKHGVKIFLDAQGFVRGAKKNLMIYELDFWNYIFCMKCNEDEVKEIPFNIIKNQKKKCLIITKGGNGVVVYFKNKKYFFAVEKIKPSDTIGAGDTFFAAFVTGFIKGDGDIARSVEFALKEVRLFLLAK
jgi:hypothetical protein